MKEKKLKGKGAQVFQHEHDHLRGVTLKQSGLPATGKLTREETKEFIKRLKKQLSDLEKEAADTEQDA